MRRTTTLIALWVGVCLMMSATPATAGVDWAEASFEDIVKLANSENKHVFIDFYTTWCSPCKKLDEVTYQDEKVVTFLGEMIPVKYDAEKGAGIKLAKKYHINVYPTLVLLGPDGKEIDRHIGYLDPEPFVKVMKDYTNGINTVAYYKKKVEEDPSDEDSWKVLGKKHAEAGRYDGAKKALSRYMELAPGVSGDEKAELLYTLGDIHYQSESYKDAAKIFENMIEEFADTDWQDNATVRLARTHHKLGDEKACVETYMAYVNRHPDDTRAMNSFAWFCASQKVGLDEALPVALKAAEVSGRDAGILDTLAELYYARGEYDKAIEVGKEALEKDADDKYLADQVEKFKKAKAEADSQARK
jgi:tetratricopeptide (TPR) repeat protein